MLLNCGVGEDSWESPGLQGDPTSPSYRGWDGWMASLTQRTWVWSSSRSWWWTEKPGMLWGPKESDTTEQPNWTEQPCNGFPRLLESKFLNMAKDALHDLTPSVPNSSHTSFSSATPVPCKRVLFYFSDLLSFLLSQDLGNYFIAILKYESHDSIFLIRELEYSIVG